MEHASGTTGGFLSIVLAHVTGMITFQSTLECLFTATIGAVTGYFVVKGIKLIEKKCKKTKDDNPDKI